ncbi:RNA polymerase sigma-70 factor [Pedobacter nyackensis]|uniref:RNA polymerase sigma factor n=1 Tax=Pedobacter nyackensis TaxID=475255 RepID=UPI002930DFA9|nr:RNA polymerase sigma-70 factor [Pedobacter nyackensis]
MVDYSNFSDQELTALLRERDQLAFTEVYRRYWHPLYLHAYKMLSDEDQAKDVIQELFIAFWSKNSTMHISTSLKSYLYVMARNRVINYIRKNRINDDFIVMLAEAMPEADERLIKQIDDRNLIALIDEEINLLPPRMKQVFEMSRKDFLTNKEIAALLGTTEETVKKQISNSIKTIKIKLDKYAGASVILLEIMRYRH